MTPTTTTKPVPPVGASPACRRHRPKVFDDRITIRLRADTKQAITSMGHVSRRRFTQFARLQIETALDTWLRTHPKQAQKRDLHFP